MTRAVLFDFGGTLDADGVPWKERFRRLYMAQGVTMDHARFDPVFFSADDALLGALSRCGLRETVARLTASVSAGLGLADDRVTAAVAEGFLRASRVHLTRSRALLARLRLRYRLGVVSNFYGNLDAVCDESGLGGLFDVVVDSTLVGCAKPDPRIFRCATDALGVAARETTFVGDSPARDMAGARALGMRHVWLTEERAPVPCCPDDRTIASLAEVEALL